MRKAIAAAIILVCLASTAEAEKMAAMGFGATSCGQFGQSYSKYTLEAERAYFSWGQGWMTGMNFAMIWPVRLQIWLGQAEKAS